MPLVTAGGARLFYRLEGSGDRPVLVLSHSIGADHGLWDLQMPDLLPHFRILRYDTRGHGASEAPAGGYSIEQLGRDALGLADSLGIGKFAFCGLSLGGMTGQWIALHAPDRLTHLVLANTSPCAGPPENWETRRRTVIESGMAAVAGMVMERCFSPQTLARRDPYAASLRQTLLATDPAGYAGCCAAIRDMDHTGLLREIRAPALVIAGDRDVATPWNGHGEVLAREIPGARVVRLPAAHLSNLERPRAFSMALLDFLLPAATAAGALEPGFQIRRAVLGDAHVDQSVAKTTEFNRDFQDLITRYAWGTIWARPGLDRRTRRLLVLVMTAALGRWEEFRLHVRTGLEHELEPCDLKEALLQTAVYAGLPAANTAFQIAGEETARSQGEAGGLASG